MGCGTVQTNLSREFEGKSRHFTSSFLCVDSETIDTTGTCGMLTKQTSFCENCRLMVLPTELGPSCGSAYQHGCFPKQKLFDKATLEMT